MDEEKNEQKISEAPEAESTAKKIEITEHVEQDEETLTDTVSENINGEVDENTETEEEKTDVQPDTSDQEAEHARKTDEEETEASQTTEDDESDKDQDDSTVDNQEDVIDDSDISEETDEHTVNEELDTSKTVGEAIEDSEKSHDLSDEEIDKVVDDIVRTESDEVIAEADAKLAALKEAKQKKSFKEKLATGFRAWWENRPIRYGTFAALFMIFVAITLLPTTRYAVLNVFGVRVSSSMTVIDSQTRLPLKNISVALQDKSGVTDAEGYVSFDGLKLGSSTLAITKIGYADNTREIVLGWGSNPIGEQELVATGEQFTFVLRDWQSGAVITKAEATAGENSAKADENGKIVLTVGQENIADVEVTITAENYRDEIFTSAELNDGEITVEMVSAKKHVFVSNRSGQYDLYKIDVDTQNEAILLSSTGKEREVPYVLTHPTRNLVAYVSSRDGDENSDGFILDGLFLVDVNTGDAKRIARSEQLQLLGWSGDTLVFWQVVEGTSRANPERSKIIAYNERTSERTELAAANYFNDIELIGDTVYYAVSSYAVPQSQAKLYRVGISGEDNVKLLDKQVWSIYRNAYNSLLFNSEDQKWYEKLVDGELQETGQQPTPQGIKYIDSVNGEKTAWVEVRDGKGVLLMSTTDEIQEEQVVTLPGLSEVLYWANDTSIVFRVISNSETADYLVDITKNEAIKITDVTATQNRYF